VGVHRTRFEFERVLGRYGASDLAFVEVDANASVQFAMHGRYVQLAVPLPDPDAARFTHTPTGRPRTVAAQERAYEQALREHWRALLLAVRGKLQSVESGISTFENEFAGFLVPQFHEGTNGKGKKPKAVTWLLGSSHTLAVALVAAFLVPASAVSAFALPPSVVDRLSAPFRVVGEDEQAASDDSRPFALGRSDWTRGESEFEGEEIRVAAPADSEPAVDDGSNSSGNPAALPPAEVAHYGDGGSTGSSHDAGPAPGGGQDSSAAKSDNEPAFVPAGNFSAPDTGEEEASPPIGSEDEPPSGGDGAPSSGEEVQPPSAGSDDEDVATPPGPDADPESPPNNPGQDKDKDKDNGHDNGNHNGADNGHDNGNHNGADNGHDNGNHNGADNGQKADDRGNGKSKAEKG
jgi:hypothetical protein